MSPPYGRPSRFEANVVRRYRHGLAGAADAVVVVQPHPASGSFRHHHPQRTALRAPSCRDADDRSARAPADRAWHGQAAPDLHHGGFDAISVGVAHPLSRVFRQYPELGRAQARADGPGHARAPQLLRMDRRPARHDPGRGRRSAGSEVDAGRGRRRGGDDAQHTDREGARRRHARLCSERRAAAARARLSASLAAAGL